MDKQQFTSSYASFQRNHTFISLAFLVMLAVQVVVFYALSLWQIFEGYKTMLLIGIEICGYLLASKLNEKGKGLFCPACLKVLMYKFGKEVISTGHCPHCKTQIIK